LLTPIFVKDPVQGLAAQPGELPEGVGPLDYPPPDAVRHLLCQQHQFFLVGLERLRQLADQPLAGVVPEIELVVLDLRQVSEVDADLLSKGPQRQPFCLSQFPKPFTERHGVTRVAGAIPSA
jgi:hypothetical protein